ncbi:MAG: serine--tRNA ligase [Flavobacteriaceae bacterium]|nr:serine--tRNA ligase [Flavobacteriaceae bacterium]MBL6678610.1 serine--tRNA ligase [Flavobacteriaceae bacterium]
MLSIDYITNSKDDAIIGLKKRGFKNLDLLDSIIELNNNRKKIQQELDNILFKSNTISKDIAEAFKSGNNDIDIDSLKSESSNLKLKSKSLAEELDTVKIKISDLITTVPNIPDSKVPDGLSEENNIEVFRSSNFKESGYGLKNHWDLSKEYDIIDFELGSKITGSGFPVYKGKGAKLQRALINFFLDRNSSAGYNEFQVPHLVNSDSAYATGQLPDKDGQMYHVINDDFYLIPTAEVPLTNIYRDKILAVDQVPVMMTGYTPCFRREAGSYGSDVRGLNRLHQFDKVEIVRIEHPDKSDDALIKMKEYIKEILTELKLDFRILNLCAGDLGFTSSITYDFEVFSKGQEKWLEISSVSNFKTYQSNRLNLKFKDKDGKNYLLHTLNGSSLALPRVMAGLIENNQSENGIIIPDVLVPYTGFDIIN